LFLRTFETAVVTLDLRSAAANLTYDEHYRLAVYVDCKPCPTAYKCDYEQDPPTCTKGPTVAEQQLNLERCLAKHVKRVCVTATGNFTDCAAAAASGQNGDGGKKHARAHSSCILAFQNTRTKQPDFIF
jgi:hypothetical protein